MWSSAGSFQLEAESVEIFQVIQMAIPPCAHLDRSVCEVRVSRICPSGRARRDRV